MVAAAEREWHPIFPRLSLPDQIAADTRYAWLRPLPPGRLRDNGSNENARPLTGSACHGL